jgi:hypothetical protein
MKCDVCGWCVAERDYDGDGECFCCFEGIMSKGVLHGTKGEGKKRV